jgi:CcmD family protein
MDETTKFLFLTAAYAVFWIGTFGYTFYLHQRQRALERELAALQTEREQSTP